MTTADSTFWDSIAEKYAAKPVEDVTAFERKQAITRSLLHPAAHVLEIGCGTGSLALALAPHAGHIDAIDSSAEMIRIANTKRQTQAVANVTFTRATVDSLQSPPAHYDCVWAYSLLHLIHDRKHTLDQVFDLLKPGGTFVASHVCLAGTWIPYGPLISLMHWLGKAPRVYLYDRKTVFEEMQHAGFVDIAERDVGAATTVAFVVAKKPG
ncbi:MAG: methyltransferase domain-containing protein [Polyangiales bacterium]